MGDVGEVAAPQVDGATGGAIERRRDAMQRVEIVVAEIAVGAVGDGREIRVFVRRWFLGRGGAGVFVAIFTRRGFSGGTRRPTPRRAVIWAGGTT